METIYTYTIKLLRYVLNGDVPELPENIDFERLFAFGKSHGVENMLYVGLRDLKIAVPEDTMKKFKTAYEMQIMVEATQALELEALGEEFEKAGIDYLPLKGSVVRYLYPMPDYRKSGDIDIYIRPEQEKLVEPVMKSLGYTRKKDYDSHDIHLSYNKPPFVEVEVHRSITRYEDRSYKFCKHAWDYAVKKDGKEHSYTMSNEYLYTHLMAHLCKHLYLGGAGIRLIMDLYVMRKNAEMDEKLLSSYLKKARLTELHKMCIGLVKKWFGDCSKSDQNVYILENIVFTSGSFGTVEIKNAMQSSDTSVDKTKKLIYKIFPPVFMLKKRYSFLEKKPYFLPVMWIYRIFEMVLFERKRISDKVLENFDDTGHNADIEKIVKVVKDI